MNNPLILIPFSVFIALLSAWIGFYLGLRKHFKQILWDKKLKAYESIANGLMALREDCREPIQNPEFFLKLSQKEIMERQEKFYNHLMSLNKGMGLGPALISKEALLILKNLLIGNNKIFSEFNDDPRKAIFSFYNHLEDIRFKFIIQAEKDINKLP